MSKPDNLADRIKLLLSSGDGADVHFLVEEGDEKEELSAHKLILKSASDVFEAMFRFDTENAKNGAVDGKAASSSDVIGTVVVTDVQIGAFKAMLNFIYSDDLSALSGDNVMAVLYTAKKYHITGLAKACLAFPVPKLRNVFLAFDQARLLEEKDFAEHCLDFIDENAETLIKSDAFLPIDQKLMCEILSRDQLKISGEIEISIAALRWANEQCRQNDKDSTAANVREMLGPALFKIRFPLIPQDEFSKLIVPLRVLKHEEIVSVLLCHSHPDSSVPDVFPLQFSTKKRIYMRKGRISMKIENLSKFMREKGPLLSDAVYVKGLKWSISAYSNVRKGTKEKCLAFFLDCSAEATEMKNWSCSCRARLRIVSQKKGANDYTLLYNHEFNHNSKSWGLPYFMEFEKLMDTDNGWYDKEDDSVTLAVDVSAEEPYGEDN
ncbi:hypothetical protein niasHS_004543 [Heterodera schachtii]|uniref:BTB domain-containing protein n=1 Tax=Heterodera schachtii TaxID=97005 RepID=A0ABD2JML6_HETSC